MRWFATVCLMLALSGCVVQDDGPGGTPTTTQISDESTTSETGSGSSTTGATTSATPSAPPVTNTTTSSSPTPAPQRAPTANLTASATNGTAPLNVTFMIAGSDPDGDALNWTLSYGDGNQTSGSGLPANRTHRFLAPGTFTVSLVVTDGNGNVTRSLVVTLTQSAPATAPAPLDPACQRPDAVAIADEYYIDDRGSGVMWFFQEANGIPGLQLTQEPSTMGDVDSLAVENGCQNGDTLVF